MFLIETVLGCVLTLQEIVPVARVLKDISGMIGIRLVVLLVSKINLL